MVLVPALSEADADPALLPQPQLPAFIDPASGRFSFSFNTQHPQPEAGEDGNTMEAEADRSSIFSPYNTYNPYYPAFGRGFFAGHANGWGYPAYPQYNPWTAPRGYPAGARGAFYVGGDGHVAVLWQGRLDRDRGRRR